MLGRTAGTPQLRSGRVTMLWLGTFEQHVHSLIGQLEVVDGKDATTSEGIAGMPFRYTPR